MDILNALVAFLNFVFIPGLAYGAQLAIGALGVTLVFSILRFSNFAHGDTMAFGTMWSILITWWFQSMGVNFGPLPTALLAIPFAIVITAAMLLGTDKLVYSFYRKQKAAPIIMVIVSAGVMFIMNGLVRLIIGVEEQSFADGARFVVAAADFKAWSGLNEGLAIKTTRQSRWSPRSSPWPCCSGSCKKPAPANPCGRFQITKIWPCCPASTRTAWCR